MACAHLKANLAGECSRVGLCSRTEVRPDRVSMLDCLVIGSVPLSIVNFITE
jgi:hypothetical protein